MLPLPLLLCVHIPLPLSQVPVIVTVTVTVTVTVVVTAVVQGTKNQGAAPLFPFAETATTSDCVTEYLQRYMQSHWLLLDFFRARAVANLSSCARKVWGFSIPVQGGLYMP